MSTFLVHNSKQVYCKMEVDEDVSSICESTVSCEASNDANNVEKNRKITAMVQENSFTESWVFDVHHQSDITSHFAMCLYPHIVYKQHLNC